MIKRIKEKWHVLQADEHMREIAKGTLLAFILKVIGAGLAFAFNVAIARLLGAEGAGLFFLALSVTAIGSVIGRVGLDNTLLRFTATHAAKGEASEVKGVYRLGMRIAVTASGTLALFGFWLAPWMASEVFQKTALAEPLRWMCLAILPFALLNLQAESLKGLKDIRSAMLTQSIGVPLLGLLLIWPLAKMKGVEGVSWAYFSATIMIALLGVWAWQRTITKLKAPVTPYPFATLWASCKPLFITSLMNQAVLPWAPLLLLGIWVDSQDVGIFGAASRIAMLVSFMLMTVNNVLAPKFAELYAKGEIAIMGQTARRSALFITLLTSPIFFILTFGGKWVMLLFGPEFIEGAFALAILAMGQFVNTLTGSVNHFLLVTGNEVIVRNITLFATFWLVGISIVLIPLFGITGAAIASASSIAILNILSCYMVWAKFDVLTIPFLP